MKRSVVLAKIRQFGLRSQATECEEYVREHNVPIFAARAAWVAGQILKRDGGRRPCECGNCKLRGPSNDR